jgi:biotin carboxylase
MTAAPVLAVSGAGTAAGFALVEAAKTRLAGVRVLALDSEPRELVGAATLADAFERVPLARDEGFAGVLREVLERHGATAWIPIIDAEIVVAAGERDRLPGVCVMVPSEDAARTCLDKLEMARWLADNGLPTPPTVPATAWREIAGPRVLKPRTGYGSQGLLRRKADASPPPDIDLAGMIAQPALAAPECTVDLFRDPGSGLFRALARERLEVKAGVCVKARVFADEELAALAERLAAGLDLSGAACLQVMRGDSGWEITDVNPRPGAGTPMCTAAGVDFIAAHAALALGRDPLPWLPPLAAPVHVVRQFRELVTGPAAP